MTLYSRARTRDDDGRRLDLQATAEDYDAARDALFAQCPDGVDPAVDREVALLSRQIMVTFETESCAYVRGHGARELLIDLKGRAPVWGTIARAWCVQAKTARDVIALAEARGYDIVVTREEAVTLRDKIELDEITADHGRLW
ncbi:MAG: hypothetical protein QM655_12670 [Nocardioidaceae bacterium]